MRVPIKVGLGIVAALALAAGAAVPAHADTTASGINVRLSSSASDARSSALVTATLEQTKYADISIDVSFTGFMAMKTFAYRPGACPTDVIRLNIPAEVTECGWEQEGKTAKLRMAVKGTFPAASIGIRVTRGALMTPKKPGKYAVEVSSWAFAPVKATATIQG
jgi:hypothetical protein